MVAVVNMIPRSLSGETNQDSEPTLAVNPTNPLQIVGTAFTPNPMGAGMAPIYVSNDGGNTWTLSFIVPSEDVTGDITVAFGTRSSVLYAGILKLPAPPDETILNILRTKNVQSPTPMAVLAQRSGVDQPYVQALTSGQGKDQVYVGDNDFASPGQTSTLDIATSATVAKPKFKSIRLERRGTGLQNGPQVRPAVHSDGTVYAAFYHWRAESGDWRANTLVVTADVVVVRDDRGGAGTNPFRALVDTDGIAGKRVVQNVNFPFHQTGRSVPGQQRLGGDLAIATDPRNSNSSTVYIAWADGQLPNYTLHVRNSTDRGVTWSPNDLLTVPFGINAGLAINNAGQVGLLYQQLTGAGANQRWETHFQRTTNGTNWDDLVLATTPADTPALVFSPYLGDYAHVLAVDGDFYGIFSASNIPDLANFPDGVTYQRNADFNAHKLLDTDGRTEVRVSIDPFFFKV